MIGAGRDGGNSEHPIGVLALQGDFARHAQVLDRLGRRSRLIRTAGQLEDLAGLIIPGGESTTMLKLMAGEDLIDPLQALARRGLPILGTCAGLVLLAREVYNPPQPSLGLLDLTVERNGYGRQIDSFIAAVVATELGPEPLEGVFIRAPIIRELGSSVRVLGDHGGHPVIVQQAGLLGCSFHPELTADTRVHSHFLRVVDSVRAGRHRRRPAQPGLDAVPACPLARRGEIQ